MSSLSESRCKRKLVYSNEEKKKKKASVSLWSKEDDISLLKGMIDYEGQNQSSPYADMGKFLDFVKPSLHFDVQRKQLTDRLWRLRTRCLSSDYDTSKPHHAKLFELAKSINSWGHHANVSLDGDKSGNVVTSDDRNGKKDDVGVDDVDIDKSSKVVKNKEKGKLVTSDCEDGKKDNVVVGDVDKSSKVVTNKKKREIVTSDGQNGKKGNVVIDEDIHVDKGLEVVKKKRKFVVKKKRKFVNGDGQNVKEVDVISDDVNGRKSSKVVENKKKRKVVTWDCQNDKEDAVVVEDVNAGKCEQAVIDKSKGNVVTRDDQNVGEDTVVVDELGGDGSKSGQVVKDRKKGKFVIIDGQDVEENVPREVNKKDLKYFTSMYPESTNVLELETPCGMPQHIRKNFVMDTINSMGREKANELEKKWADLRLMELELHAKKLDMTNKQINLIMEAMRR